MAIDNYNPATSLTAYYPSRTERRTARLWAREKVLHDLADLGAVEFFEGGGTDATALSGYATDKLWLRADAGVTDAAAEIHYYAGGDPSLVASWPILDREGFSAHLGARSGGEFDYVWSIETSGDPGEGKARGNHATLSSVTAIALSKTGRQGQDYAARLLAWQPGNTVRLYAVGNESSYVEAVIDSAVVDEDTYVIVACSVVTTSSIADGVLVSLAHIPAALSLADDWAQKTDGAVLAPDGFSAKAWAVGGTDVTDTAERGSAKEWATKAEDATVDGSGYSSFHWAQKAAAAAVDTAADRVLTSADVVAAESAKDDAETARDAAFANADVYADIATGRAAVSDTEQFMVVSGNEIVRYRRDSSSTQTVMARYPTSGYAEEVLAAAQAVQLGAAPLVVGTFDLTPIIDLNLASVVVANGRYVAGVGGQAPPRNMVPRNSGKIAGTLSSGTATEFHAAGPQGATTAKRLQMDNSAAYSLLRDTLIPAGPYTVKLKAKSSPGQGTADFRFGVLSGGGGSMAEVSTTEADWTTLSTTVTPDGTSDEPRIAIHNNLAGAAIDILIDEVQFYLSEETIPDYEDEVTSVPMLRDDVSYPGALHRDGFALDTRTKPVRGFIPFSTFPLTKTFTEVTMMALVKSTDIASLGSKVLTFDGPEGTLSIGTNVGKFYAAPVLPRLTTNPAHWMAGDDWHVLTLRVKAGEQAAWVDKFKHTIGASAPTIPVKSGLMLGNDEGLTSGREFLGLYSQIAVWDYWLTDAQIRTAVDVLAARHAIAGHAPIATRAVWIAEGDSISANADATPNGPGYQAQYAQSADRDRGILCQNNAVSGSNLTHLTTRLTSTYLTERIAAAVASGYQVVVSVLIGANGLPTIGSLETYWSALKTAGASVVALTILPRDDGTIDNTARKALNVQILGSSVPDAVADIAADADIGSDGAPTAGVYYHDLTHLNAAGHAIAMGIIAPVVEGLIE